MPISLFTWENSENHFSWGHFIKKENKNSAQLAKSTSQAGQKEQHSVSQSTTNTREPLYRKSEYYTSRHLMTFESDYKKIYT